MGNSCDNCDPCPPCETQFPVTCESLPVTTEALSFVVEDSGYCKKIITGTAGQIPQINDEGFIDFVNTTSNATPNSIVSRDSLGGASFGIINGTGLNVNNPSGDTKIEIGGSGNVYVDLKNPTTDDYDLRLEATAGDQKIYTNNSKLLIDASTIALQSVTNQDVGIGTNAPIAKLDVVENQVGQTAIRVNNPNTSTSASAGLLAQHNSVSGQFLANANTELRVGTTTNHPIRFITNNTNKASILANGNVGIGTNAPSSLLHVVNTTTDAIVNVESTTGATRYVGTNATGYVVQNNSNTSTFITTNGTIKLTVAAIGDVGIGTTSPSAALHVIRSVAGGIKVTGQGSDYTPIQIENLPSSSGVGVQVVANGITRGELRTYTAHPLVLLTNSTDRVTILATGNVGINESAPAHQLEVNGGIRSKSDTAGVGYSTGAGGSAPTVGTGTGQTVTINKICGTITCANAAGSTTRKAVVVTNSKVGEFDTVIISGKGGANAYEATVFNVKSGEFSFQYNSPTGTISENPLFNFSVIKSVNA